MLPVRTVLVTTTAGGKKRHEIWNTDRPLVIGHVSKWRIEKNAAGFVARSLTQSEGSTIQAYRINPEVALSGKAFQLPSGVVVEFKKIEHSRPMYTSLRSEGAQDKLPLHPDLMIVHGIRSYVAESRRHGEESDTFHARVDGESIFSLERRDSQYVIFPTSSEVVLKIEGMEPKTLPSGKAWILSPAQIAQADIHHGTHWWRFAISEHLGEASLLQPEHLIAREDRGFRRLLAGVSAVAMLLTLLSALMPDRFKTEELPLEAKATSVTFHHEVARAKGSFTAPKKKTEVAQAPAAAPVEQPKAAPAPVAPAAPAVAQAAPAKPAVSKSTAKVAKAAPGAATADARPAVSNKAKSLRAALNGALGLARGGAAGFAAALQGGSREISSLVAGGGGGKEGPVPSLAGAVGSGSVQARTMGGGAGKNSGAVGYGGGAGDAGVGSLGQGKGFVSVESARSFVDDGLTKDQVGRVIRAHMSEIRYCYEGAALHKPDLEGRVVLAFNINLGGMVKSAKVQSSSVEERRLEQCIIEKLITWKFPNPRGGIDVAVSYPFLFKTLRTESLSAGLKGE